jgi:uridine phosphorylase
MHNTKRGQEVPESDQAGRRGEAALTPLLQAKDFAAPSVFRPENLLREARRQKDVPESGVPAICALDPDGDIVRHLQAGNSAQRCPGWACYHTELWTLEHEGERLGIVGCAVGAPFAVLVAEQLFASGCEFVISVTSSGQIAQLGRPPYFVLIEKALRDEGTSHHYLAPSTFAEIDPSLSRQITEALSGLRSEIRRGATWTTDAPFRETEAAIAAARDHGLLAVEMEAAALYAFARARNKPVLCFAHVTNEMAQRDGDFEKGVANGALEALGLLSATARAWRTRR